MAAVLASGTGAVLSHWSAAAHWGIRPNSRTRIDVTVPHATRSSSSIRRHVSLVLDDEQTVEEGIPVTTVPRTIFGLAASEPLDVVKALLRQAEFRELHDRLSLWDLVDRYPGRRGIRKVKAALEALKDEPVDEYKSRFEERFAPFLTRHALARARFNQWILVGDKRCQVDCLWPEQRQIVELDGWEGHKTRTAFREDRARDRKLRVAGYHVTRLTWTSSKTNPRPSRRTFNLFSVLRGQPQVEEKSRLSRAAATSTCHVEVAAARPESVPGEPLKEPTKYNRP
jgi:very-short-patch-repair endonuclease